MMAQQAGTGQPLVYIVVCSVEGDIAVYVVLVSNGTKDQAISQIYF
jgi:hypothetical protein